MKDKIITFWAKEVKTFFLLSQGAKILLIASSFFIAVETILYLFLNLYLWRLTQDIKTLAIFNLLADLGLIAGFLINGYLLKKLTLSQALQIGFLGRAIFLTLLLLFKSSILEWVVLLGFLWGLIASFYWANYTTIFSFATSDRERNFYSGLKWILDELSAFLTPTLAGFLITFLGVKILGWDIASSYLLVFGLSLLITILGVYFSTKIYLPIHISFSFKNHLNFLKKVPQIKILRPYYLIMGFWDGVLMFLVGIILINFFNQEVNVGLLSSLGTAFAIGSAIVLAKTKTHKRNQLLLAATALYSFGAILAASFFSKLAIVVFVITRSVASTFIWGLWYPLVLGVWDKAKVGKESRYHFTFDAEIMLDIGRISSIIAFFIGFYLFGEETSFRLALFVFGLTPLLLNFASKKLSKL